MHKVLSDPRQAAERVTSGKSLGLHEDFKICVSMGGQKRLSNQTRIIPRHFTLQCYAQQYSDLVEAMTANGAGTRSTDSREGVIDSRYPSMCYRHGVGVALQ